MAAMTATLAVNYDATSDVLYIALGKPVPAETDMDSNGLLVRYAESDGHPIGVTVMGFRSQRWSHDVSELAILVGAHLSVSATKVSKAFGRIA